MKGFLWVVSFLCLFPWQGFGLQLQLFDEIGANESRIVLGRLGTLQLKNQKYSQERLQSLAILDIPEKPVFLSSGDLEAILKSRYGIKANIVGSGVRIYPLYTRILNQEIAEKIKTELRKIYPTLSEDFVDIMLMKSPKFPKIPAGTHSYTIRIPRGRMDVTKYVRLQVKDADKELINTSFPIRLVFRVPTWKSRKKLRAGTIVKREDFSLHMSSHLQEPKNFMQKTEPPFGKKLKKTLHAGQILSLKYLFT